MVSSQASSLPPSQHRGSQPTVLTRRVVHSAPWTVAAAGLVYLAFVLAVLTREGWIPFGLALGSALLLAIAQRATNHRLDRLDRAVEAWLKAKWSVRTGISSSDTVGRLAGHCDELAARVATTLRQFNESLVEAKQTTDAASAEESRLRAIMASVADGLIIFDDTFTVQTINPATERMFGVTAEEVVGQPVTKLVPEFALDPDAIGVREALGRKIAGLAFPVEIGVNTVEIDGQKLHIGMVRDITARREMQSELERLATTDSLTGLANRHKAMQALEAAFRQAEVLDQPLSIVVLDIDFFKLVNDRYGHAVGDEVLRRLAEVLKDSVRASDIVSRWGGEEFMIAMYGMPKDGAARRMQETLARCKAQVFDGEQGQQFVVSFSAGVAEYTSDGRTLFELYRAADEALYKAKENGRSRVELAPGKGPRTLWKRKPSHPAKAA